MVLAVCSELANRAQSTPVETLLKAANRRTNHVVTDPLERFPVSAVVARNVAHGFY